MLISSYFFHIFLKEMRQQVAREALGGKAERLHKSIDGPFFILWVGSTTQHLSPDHDHHAAIRNEVEPIPFAFVYRLLL